MADIVKVLPENVSGRIAAGEVVQRPASVVKEMVENAIDAGASSVKILLTDAGRTSIQIIDNGCGMSETDASTAFKRHATSKISTPEDLFNLHTFGFRGEALASIAAVAEVELSTRREEDEIGTRIKATGEMVFEREPVSCPVGCNFIVRNLFYNIPARRRFLKSNQTESGHIMTEVERAALAHPEVAFSLYQQGDEVLTLPADGLKQRIVGLFGKSMNKNLLPVQVETAIVTVSGYVGTLDSVRRKGSEQFFFVNGRFMKHPYFHKAVLEPYENLVPEGEQPSYFLYLTVPADAIDVNIHPAKTEIKFSEEASVWKILNAAVREAVGRFEEAPTIEFDTEGMPDIPVYDASQGPVSQPRIKVDPTYNPFTATPSSRPKTSTDGWAKLYGDALTHKVEDGFVPYEPMEMAQPETFSGFQFRGRFVVAGTDRGVMVIDQRRAHIRILYEQYMKQMENGQTASQGMLFPEMFQLSPADAALLPQYQEELSSLGFDISDMGHGAVSIQGIPSDAAGADYEKLVMELLHSAAEGGKNLEDRRGRMALSMARASAAVKGQTLNEQEMKDLVKRLMACEMPARTPDGHSVYLLLSDSDLDF